MESTGPVGGATAATSGKESDLSLLEQFKQAASESSELDDSEFEDAVQTALGNALEDIFESGRVSIPCVSKKMTLVETRKRHFINK